MNQSVVLENSTMEMSSIDYNEFDCKLWVVVAMRIEMWRGKNTQTHVIRIDLVVYFRLIEQFEVN